MIESPTSKSVLDFAEVMEYKLSLNRHKGDREGWLKAELPAMIEYLWEETEELKLVLATESFPEIVEREAADIANFAMMIADIYRTNYK